MAQLLEKSVVRILNGKGTTAGTGFLVEKYPGRSALVVTCAHVIRCAGSGPGETVQVEIYHNGKILTAQVLTDGWFETEDTAFLQLKPCPAGCEPVELGNARQSMGHEYASLGFPRNSGPAEAARPHGQIDGMVKTASKRDLLELIGESMGPGMSGAPVLDLATHRVVGMVASHRDEIHTRVVYAIPLNDIPRGPASTFTRLLRGARGLLFSIAILAVFLSLRYTLPFFQFHSPTHPPIRTGTPLASATRPADTPPPASTPTPPATFAPTAAPTLTKTLLPTANPTPSFTPTVTASETMTATATITPTITITPTPTLGEILDRKGHIMIPVPAGTFNMGSENGQADERPVHPVFLDTFYIDKYEVTNAQYRQCVAAKIPGCTAPHDAHYKNNSGEYDDYPVGTLRWSQAEAFCEWRGGSLPTEAQWEKTARGNTENIFPWGNEWPGCDIALYGGCARNAKGRPDSRPVGSYPRDASPYGVYDLGGSMIEWVLDWYGENFYEIFSLKPLPNPTGPANGTLKVTRGGGWSPNGVEDLTRLRSADREKYDLQNSYANVGFRCVLANNND